MIDTLSPELQANEALKGFNTVDEMGKSYAELHAKVSSGSIDVLPEPIRKTLPEKYKTFTDLATGYSEAQKLIGGIKRPPADVTGYKFGAPEGMNPKIGDPKGFQTAFAAEALKMGLSEDQADGAQKVALGFFSTMVTENEKRIEANRQKNEAALKQEWGADYDKNLNTIVRAFKAAGGDEVANEFSTLAFKNAPLVIKALGKIMSQLSESTIDGLGTGGGGGDVNTEMVKEYKAYAEAIRTNDQKHPIFDRKHKDHNLAQEKWPKLQQAYFESQKK